MTEGPEQYFTKEIFASDRLKIKNSRSDESHIKKIWICKT